MKISKEPNIKSSIKNINYSIDELLALNENHPSSVMVYLNGRYGLRNKEGERFSVIETQGNCSGALSCIISKANKSHEIKDKRYSYRITYGNDCYYVWIIKASDRQQSRQKRGKKLLILSNKLSGLNEGFPGGLILSTGIPCPETYVWDKGMKESVVLEEYSGQELTYEDIQQELDEYIKDLELTKHLKEEKAKPGMSSYIRQTNSLFFDEVFDRLKKYPKIGNGYRYYYVLQSGKLCLHKTNDEGLLVLDGYLLDEGKANISVGSSLLHPYGSVYDFLFRYFEGITKQLEDFLRNEFKIDRSNSSIDGLGEIVETYSGLNSKVILHDYGVALEEEVVVRGEKQQVRTITKTIMKSGIKILGKGKSVGLGIGEQEARNAYLMETNSGTTLVIPASSKREHNNKYNDELFFYGEDNDLGTFYNTLNKSNKIQEIRIYEHSGFYGSDVILGGELIKGTGGDTYNNPRIAFDICSDLTQVSLKEYLDLMLKIYTPELALPAVLQSIALAGMNIWEGFTTYPALLISGKTGSGKSQIMTLLKTMLGYKTTSRTMSLPGITPQPLKQAACDPSILFLEELTQRVGEATEELLRNIVNHDKGARGASDKNFEFPFRSPLFVVGERTFKDESLNNRFLTIISTRKSWIPNSKKYIHELSKLTAYEDIYTTLSDNKEELSGLAVGYSDKLASMGIDSRTADTYSFIFAVNDIFDLGYDFDYLYGIVDHMIKRSGLGDEVEENSWKSLEGSLVSILSKKQGALIISDDDKNMVYELAFYGDDIYQKEKGKISSCLMEINEELGGWYGTANSSRLKFKVKIERSKGEMVGIAKKINDLFTNIVKRIPGGYGVVTINSMYF